MISSLYPAVTVVLATLLLRAGLGWTSRRCADRAVEDIRIDLRARIATTYDLSTVDLGASIACDGICLTVVAKGPDWFEVDISAETLARTSIGAQGWRAGQRINLERALRVGDELGGHIVSGHVDGVGSVAHFAPVGESWELRILAPADQADPPAAFQEQARGDAADAAAAAGDQDGVAGDVHDRLLGDASAMKPRYDVHSPTESRHLKPPYLPSGKKWL